MHERPAGPSSQLELSPPLFEIAAAEGADGVVISLKGELDLFERPRLEAAINLAEESEAGGILIDLEELTFVDVAGLTSLLGAQRRSTRNGNRLRITPGRGSVAALFQLTGLDTRLPLATTELSGVDE